MVDDTLFQIKMGSWYCILQLKSAVVTTVQQIHFHLVSGKGHWNQNRFHFFGLTNSCRALPHDFLDRLSEIQILNTVKILILIDLIEKTGPWCSSSQVKTCQLVRWRFQRLLCQLFLKAIPEVFFIKLITDHKFSKPYFWPGSLLWDFPWLKAIVQ